MTRQLKALIWTARLLQLLMFWAVVAPSAAREFESSVAGNLESAPATQKFNPLVTGTYFRDFLPADVGDKGPSGYEMVYYQADTLEQREAILLRVQQDLQYEREINPKLKQRISLWTSGSENPAEMQEMWNAVRQMAPEAKNIGVLEANTQIQNDSVAYELQYSPEVAQKLHDQSLVTKWFVDSQWGFVIVRTLVQGTVSVVNLHVTKNFPWPMAVTVGVANGILSGCAQYWTSLMGKWLNKSEACQVLKVKNPMVAKAVHEVEKFTKWAGTEILFYGPVALASNYLFPGSQHVRDILAASAWATGSQGALEMAVHNNAERQLLQGKNPKTVEFWRQAGSFTASIVSVALVTAQMGVQNVDPLIVNHWAKSAEYGVWALTAGGIIGAFSTSYYMNKAKTTIVESGLFPPFESQALENVRIQPNSKFCDAELNATPASFPVMGWGYTSSVH